MTSRCHGRTLTAYGLVVLTVLLPAAARSQAPGTVPPEWKMVPGWTVFVDKGCGTCHRVRGIGDGTVGPDLAGLQASRGLFDLGAAMWNHLPRMGAALHDLGIQRPQHAGLRGRAVGPMNPLSTWRVSVDPRGPTGK